jgi:hypothetical protein
VAKKIHHMGMTVTKKEADDFHKSAPILTPGQHEALMKRMGISKEEDEEWHRTHLTLAQLRTQGLREVDVAALGAAFLGWCVQQGWVVAQGKQYLASKEGARELGERFGIRV